MENVIFFITISVLSVKYELIFIWHLSVETGMKSGQRCQLCLKNAKCLQLKSCRLFFEKSHVCSLISERNQIQSSYWKIRWSMYHMTEQIVHGKCLILGINDSFVKRIPWRACDEIRNWQMIEEEYHWGWLVFCESPLVSWNLKRIKSYIHSWVVWVFTVQVVCRISQTQYIANSGCFLFHNSINSSAPLLENNVVSLEAGS